ncbi:hypothetical protein MUK42_18710 [Musa troglodytarum]|uniref:Uncharacterized protein n=1 Tax=Musa troglodytarum TaxID=320322 RepID=A0A9E7JFC0_9LILI|nr:hypothetical protein MUK42_18710 [Musa troglodytarum]
MCVGISMLAVNWFSFRLDYVQLSAHTSHQPLNQLDHLAIGKRLQAWQGEDGCGCKQVLKSVLCIYRSSHFQAMNDLFSLRVIVLNQAINNCIQVLKFRRANTKKINNFEGIYIYIYVCIYMYIHIYIHVYIYGIL